MLFWFAEIMMSAPSGPVIARSGSVLDRTIDSDKTKDFHAWRDLHTELRSEPDVLGDVCREVPHSREASSLLYVLRLLFACIASERPLSDLRGSVWDSNRRVMH